MSIYFYHIFISLCHITSKVKPPIVHVLCISYVYSVRMQTDQQVLVKTQTPLKKNQLQLRVSTHVLAILRLYKIVLYMLRCKFSPYTVLYGPKMA